MLFASSISYAEEFEPSVDVSGLIFAGYGLDLSDGAEGESEFLLDRTYLTVRGNITEALSTRLTLDVGRAKPQTITVPDGAGGEVEIDVPEDTKFRYYMKYAYLQWKTPISGVKMQFGAAGSPLVGYGDKFWGHRYVSKAFTDRNKILSSSVIGLHFVGSYADSPISWQANLINGEGYGSPEDGSDKTSQLRISADLLSGSDAGSLPVTVFGSTEFLTAEDDDPTTVLVGAGGYKMSHFLLWGEYVMELEGDVTGSGYSAVVMPRIPEVGSLFMRYDYWDPNTDADLDASTTIIAGVSRDFARKVSAATTYERETAEAASDTPSHGVFIHAQAGF